MAGAPGFQEVMEPMEIRSPQVLLALLEPLYCMLQREVRAQYGARPMLDLGRAHRFGVQVAGLLQLQRRLLRDGQPGAGAPGARDRAIKTAGDRFAEYIVKGLPNGKKFLDPEVMPEIERIKALPRAWVKDKAAKQAKGVAYETQLAAMLAPAKGGCVITQRRHFRSTHRALTPGGWQYFLGIVPATRAQVTAAAVAAGV